MGKSKKKKNRRRRKMRRKKVTHKKSKGFSSYIRALIHSRADGKCQFPGCNNTGSQCHHIIPRSIAINEYGWSLDKTNSLDNGILLCRVCHEKLHRFERWKEYLQMFKTIIANASYN